MNSIQRAADRKKSLGSGKKERNIGRRLLAPCCLVI
jgi:hypothetical protein